MLSHPLYDKNVLTHSFANNINNCTGENDDDYDDDNKPTHNDCNHHWHHRDAVDGDQSMFLSTSAPLVANCVSPRLLHENGF